MELYGSLHNISGSVTASTFTGSFIGDGSGLTGIRANAVVGLNLSQIATGSFTASLSPDGFNVNTDTSITGAVNITGSISLNGEPIGTGKLNETTFQAYTSSNDGRVTALETSSGSLNSFTSSINTTIKSKLDNDGVISGSVQVQFTGTTGYGTFTASLSNSIGLLSSSIATTELNLGNRLISVENKTGSYATTGSNLFIGTQTHSGSIIPSVDNLYDLGSVTHQWRDVYISSGSLFIDGTKVLSSTTQELQITTDNGQSIKILEGGTDSIILQTADGNVELKSNADGDILLDPTNGKIMLKGPVEILNGQKIQSSVGGTPVVFANDIVVSGSIDITGTIEGINLTDFSSSVNTRVSNLESGAGSLNAFTASATTKLNSLETTTGSLNSYTSSNNTRLGVIETSTSSLNSFTSSINTTIKDRLNSEGIISGSIQVNVTETTGYSTFSSSIATTDLNQTNRLNSIESKSGSYATTGSNVFVGDQTITGSLFISQNLIVQGSSSLENITASAVSIGTNTIILNTDSPAFRYAGISVFDSGSTNVTASLFYDSLTNQWKFKHSDVGTSDASILLFGPLGNDIDNTPILASNYLTKVEGTNDHGHHITSSNIFDNGSKVSINSNTEITGTLRVTGTALVSGSSQVLNGSGVFSGSAQLPAGLVSGSSQVLAGTTIHSGSFFNGISVVSGSGQISFNGITDKPALVSGSSQISFSSIADKPALVSGSSQISYPSLSNIPGNIVSGSVQIDLTATTNYSTGIKTRLNAEGVISGSSQVTNIGNPQLVNPSFHVGTTSISLGRASAAQTLNDVSITGNAATVTNGVYTTGDQSIGGVKTFTSELRLGSSIALRDNAGEWMLGKNSTTIDIGSTAITNGIAFQSATNSTFTYRGNNIWHAGNLTNLNQLTNGPGYISSYTETDTLASVTGRGASTSTPISINGGGTQPLALTTSSGSPWHIALVRSDLGLTSRVYAHNSPYNGWYFEHNISIAGSTNWHSGNLTNLNQLTNGPGYITSLTDTLATVTSRGSITTTLVTLSKTNSTLYTPNSYNGGTGQLSITSTINQTGVYNGIRFAGGSGSHEGFFGTVQNSSGLAEFIFQTFNGSAYGERTRITSRGSLLHGHAAVPSEDAWLGTAVFGRDSYNKVIIGSLNSSTTGAYIGGHNSALNAWADLNIAGEALIFRYQQTERARFDTSGNFIPGANGTYNMGSSSLRWGTVFTSDLSLSNGIGDYTIVEGEEKLYLYNNKNNKVYSFVLQEEDPSTATPKKIY